MKKHIYFLLFIFVFLSCAKEKFENTGDYTLTFSFYIDGITEEVRVNGIVELRNETDNTIEFNGTILNKENFRIEGKLSLIHI